MLKNPTLPVIYFTLLLADTINGQVEFLTHCRTSTHELITTKTLTKKAIGMVFTFDLLICSVVLLLVLGII
jgi:hypothetical protein